MLIGQIFEQKDILSYLESRQLVTQYKKAKQYLLQNRIITVKFKERNPKGSGIWQFRINRQCRALCVFDNIGNLIVFEIDNHQWDKKKNRSTSYDANPRESSHYHLGRVVEARELKLGPSSSPPTTTWDGWWGMILALVGEDEGSLPYKTAEHGQESENPCLCSAFYHLSQGVMRPPPSEYSIAGVLRIRGFLSPVPSSWHG